MTKKKNYASEWNGVWNRQGLMTSVISFGRNIYNKFFLMLLDPYFYKSRQKKTMLEIGCGTSSFGMVLCKNYGKNFHFTGVDISDSALKLSKDNAKKCRVKNCTFIKGDCFKLPIKSNTYDVVWSQGLIEHFPNPKKTVLEHYRVTKKGGTTMISVPAKLSYMYPWYILTRPKFLRKLWPWTDQAFYSHNKFKALMKGQKIKYRTYFVQPFFLGVIVLEMKKPKD